MRDLMIGAVPWDTQRLYERCDDRMMRDANVGRPVRSRPDETRVDAARAGRGMRGR